MQIKKPGQKRTKTNDSGATTLKRYFMSNKTVVVCDSETVTHIHGWLEKFPHITVFVPKTYIKWRLNDTRPTF